MDTLQILDTVLVQDTVRYIDTVSSHVLAPGGNSSNISLIIGVLSPILTAIGGIIGWFLKAKREELQAVQERAIERRIENYNTVLRPFIVLFSKSPTKEEKDEAIKNILTPEYRSAAFNIVFYGSDYMVNAYNAMMQFFYSIDEDTDSRIGLRHFADFVLAIRKDVHDANTKLKNIDMLKFMINDIENYKGIFNQSNHIQS